MNQSKTIIVCVKQVPDSEGPESLFTIDEQSGLVSTQGLPPVISPFDENALEAALKIKEKHGGFIRVISAGSSLSKGLLRKVLAAGADELILVDDSNLKYANTDSFTTAWILAKAVEKSEDFDLILTGCQAADTNAGLVGLYMAQILNIPSISCARDADISGGLATVNQTVSDGLAEMTMPMPALITVGQDAPALRTIGLMALRSAKKKPVTQWDVKDLSNDAPPEPGLTIPRFFKPERERNCRIIQEASPEASGKALAMKLKDMGLV